MSTAPSFWFVIPAAGSGSRMQTSIPKQYLSLLDKTILDHTLSRLVSVPDVAGIVLALSDGDQYFAQSEYFHHPKINCVVGGKERCDSVLSALKFLQHKLTGQDWVLVHDAARPCVSLESIALLKVELTDHPVGGILATPVTDTLKQANADLSIIETIDRSLLWQAQTPQMFRYGVLISALKKVINECNITDEASAIELAGLSAKIVKGRSDNIKITLPADLDLAEFILRKQQLLGI